MSKPHIHFVTGRLAEFALRAIVDEISAKLGFAATIDVLPITVAALMTPSWIAKRMHVPEGTTRVILPGYCEGDLGEIKSHVPPDVLVDRGPRDLRQLPSFFGQKAVADDYGQYDIQILAEINNAPRLSMDEIVATATRYRDDGANLIDVGCSPGHIWTGVGDCIKRLKDLGLRVSVDSLQPREIEIAAKAGAELVLSVNSTNREFAPDWGIEVVVIPDDFATLGGLEETIDYLAERRVPLRVDPILEPIGFGFAASLARYMEVRRKWPEAAMMMGIGNLTELTDVDSAGVNVLLLAICQELNIGSVLTTEVINWARSSVKECDLARKLVRYAIEHKVPPKHLEPNLVCLRDPKVPQYSGDELRQLAARIKDNNYRVFVDGGNLHVISAGLHLSGEDPFLLFDELLHPEKFSDTARKPPTNVDAAHAFYLGFEMAKALTALTLGKDYRQDEALNWGHLTRPEESHRLRREPNHADRKPT
jgi:dihydropteroate synthase-like protein